MLFRKIANIWVKYIWIWTLKKRLLAKVCLVWIICGVSTLMLFTRENRKGYIATPFVQPWLPCMPLVTPCKSITDPSNQTQIHPQDVKEVQARMNSEATRFRPFIREFKNPCYLLRDEDMIYGEVLAQSERDRGLSRCHLTTIGCIEGGNNRITEETLKCLPYYFVLGFAKSATSDVYSKMMAHPYILRHQKEPLWLSHQRFDKKNAETLNDYINSFDRSASQVIAMYYQRYGTHVPFIVGDHSTHSVDSWKGHYRGIPYNSSAPAKPSQNALQRYSSPTLIKTINPAAKLIIVMRNPVDRIFSIYKYHEANSLEDFHNGVLNGIAWWQECLREGYPIERCLFDKPYVKSYKPVGPCSWEERALKSLRRGIYHLILKEWFKVFPLNQFLILNYDDYACNSSRVINDEIFPFLGLPKLSGFNEFSMNTRFGFHFDSFRAKLKTGGRIIVKYTGWSQGHMLLETRQILSDFYSKHNVKLAELLGDPKYLNWQKQ